MRSVIVRSRNISAVCFLLCFGWVFLFQFRDLGGLREGSTRTRTAYFSDHVWRAGGGGGRPLRAA